MEKESGYLLSSNGFLGGPENYSLCKTMVDHDQQRIETRGDREVSDEVTGDLLEEMGGTRLDRGQQGDGGVHV